MEDQEMLDRYLKPMSARLNVIAHILVTTKPEDDIRACLPTLIEDACEAMRDFTMDCCSVDAPVDN